MSDHATNVLYPKIKHALDALHKVPAGDDAHVDEAFNALHDAYWSECPAPADAAQRRGGD